MFSKYVCEGTEKNNGSLDTVSENSSGSNYSRPPTPFSRPLTAPTIVRPTVSSNQKLGEGRFDDSFAIKINIFITNSYWIKFASNDFFL